MTSSLVYVLDSDHGTKVGITTQTIGQRVDDLRRGAGFEPVVVATFPFADRATAERVERLTHWLLRDDRTHGEWFHTHPLVAADAVRQAMRGPTLLAYYRWLDGARQAA